MENQYEQMSSKAEKTLRTERAWNALNFFTSRVVWPARRIQEERAEDRAAEHDVARTALLQLVQAALLPLVRHEADIVQAVMKHYQWAVLVDKVCELERQYEQMISKAEDALSAMRKYEAEAWSSYGPYMNDKDFYGFDIMSGAMEERDALSSSSACEALIHNTAVELYVLKHDVVKCYGFKHPDTARSVRKIEGAKMAHRLKELLSCIDGSLKTWLRREGAAWCLKVPGVAWVLNMPRI